jgi:hypothetical protein
MRTIQAAQPSGNPHFVDFKMITAPNTQRLEAMVKHNGEVVIPIENKYGISPVGLFVADSTLNAKEASYDKKYDNVLFALTPHPNFDSTEELAAKKRGDDTYRVATATLSQGTTSKDPMFTAHERMLLRCFPEFPKVEVPLLSPNRFMQLRIYRSHSFERSRAKINQIVREDGALWVFNECGFKSVFFATTLYGAFMPSFVYMFSFESEEQKNDAWAKFVNHPGWKKLAADPAYTDTVTEIINIYLKPCKGSQI